MCTNCFPYGFNLEKFISAMTYMAHRVSDLTKLRASKLLYFADKYHLTKYGRPIIGDVYIRMDHGPVPSQSLDFMNEIVQPSGIQGMEQPTLDKMERYLAVEKKGKYPKFLAKMDPDTSVLSESDIEALNYSISAFGNVSISVLHNAGHNEQAWLRTPSNQRIDYRLFFDEEDPAQRELLSLIEESQETESFLTDGLYQREKALA
jgi:uncharacterized phage-associated protein